MLFSAKASLALDKAVYNYRDPITIYLTLTLVDRKSFKSASVVFCGQVHYRFSDVGNNNSSDYLIDDVFCKYKAKLDQFGPGEYSPGTFLFQKTFTLPPEASYPSFEFSSLDSTLKIEYSVRVVFESAKFFSLNVVAESPVFIRNSVRGIYSQPMVFEGELEISRCCYLYGICNIVFQCPR